MNLAIQVKSYTIPANGTINVDASGTFVRFYANTGKFNFSIDGGPFNTGLSSLGIPVPQEFTPQGMAMPIRPFRQIILQDLSGAANTISFIVANGALDYTPVQPTTFVKNAPTYPKATGIIALGDGLTANFSGVDTGGNIRKQIVVSNHNGSGGASLYLDDASSIKGILIPAQQSVTIETSGSVYVHNTAGSGASNYSAFETFYV
jgi:hypothetical protein